MRAPTLHIFEQTPETLRDWFVSRGLPAFRAAQVLDWVYVKGVIDPAGMTNLSKRERESLASEMTFLSGETVRSQAATDGTRKLLVQWDDGGRAQAEPADGQGLRLSLLPGTAGDSSRQTECVMIPSGEWGAGDDEDEDAAPSRVRRTACISSQVGCPVGCRFCASGIGGLDGNLTAGRIVEQVWRLRWEQGERATGAEAGESPRITNVVFMGMGEPLSNFQSVMRAVRTIAAPWGMGISARKITISTVGLPAAIEKMSLELDLPVTLALSLHAPNDALRRELIPWAEYTTIPELLTACQKWFDKTGREITLEYILLGGVNDRPEHAKELADVAKSLRANVNLIRYNEVRGMPFSRPEDGNVLAFQKILRDRRVNVHIRASRGRDIAAACGQLRHESARPAGAGA